MPTQDIPALPDADTPRSKKVESKLKEAKRAIREADRELREPAGNGNGAPVAESDADGE